MKKIMAFIFTTVLILNLLPQQSDAFRLSEDNNSVIYDYEEEQERWEKFHLPNAKYLKLVSKDATMLDIAKTVKAEQEENISAHTIMHKIMDICAPSHIKMLVKWERDNGYIDTEAEEYFGITPRMRRELLQEIEEEEEKENQSFWNGLKLGGNVLTACTAFGVAAFVKKDLYHKATIITLTAVAITTIINVVEFAIKIYNKYKKSNDEEEEIKIPPLRNMPKIPANHTRVDLYSL
jgi:hypothetical protein